MKSFGHYVFILVLSIFASCTVKPSPGKQVLIKEGFSKKVLDAYWLYLPQGYSKDKKWPLIMYLQGGDASASPNPNTVKNGGPVYYFLNQQVNLSDSFVVVNPHMSVGPKEQRQWFQNPEGLIQIINQCVKEYNVDPDRVYLTGLSRGGHGTWGVAKKYPESFAAIAPIAGQLSCQTNCDKIAEMPMWIVHNNEDPVVDYKYPVAAVKHLETNSGIEFLKTSGLEIDKAMGSRYIFTTFESNEHGGADSKLYSSPQFYKWLLSNKRIVD